MHIRIQDPEILIQGLQTYSSNVSSNRIKIHAILLILQLETDYFSKLFHFRNAPFEAVTLQSSQRPPELLFYTKKSYRILQATTPNSSFQCYTCTLHYNPENSPSRIQFYMQKTKSSSSTTLQEISTHRRQGDLLEMHPCVLQDLPMTFQAFQPQDLPKALQLLQLLQRHSGTFQSFMTFQPFQAILQILHCSSISRESTPFQHSPIRMHILHILQFYSSIGFHRKLHRVPVGQLQTLQTFILQRKGDVAISVKLTDSP